LSRNRPGHRDLVVPGKPAHQFDGRISDRRQTRAERDHRFSFDPIGQAVQDVTQQRNLLIVEPIGIGNEQIGNTPKRVHAPFIRAAVNGDFELNDKGIDLRSSLRIVHVKAYRYFNESKPVLRISPYENPFTWIK
jgi:hypothetical protein